jgi:hypothetical protein
VTNEPIDAREKVTSEATGAREIVTNEPTDSHKIVTNEPTDACEIVTNEPTLAADVGLESPTYMKAPDQNSTSEPTLAAASDGIQVVEMHLTRGQERRIMTAGFHRHKVPKIDDLRPSGDRADHAELALEILERGATRCHQAPPIPGVLSLPDFSS